MYEVQTYTMFDDWINCWKEDEQPLIFLTAAAAYRALAEFWEDLIESGMADKYQPEDYRVVTIEPEFEQVITYKVQL